MQIGAPFFLGSLFDSYWIPYGWYAIWAFTARNRIAASVNASRDGAHLTKPEHGGR